MSEHGRRWVPCLSLALLVFGSSGGDLFAGKLDPSAWVISPLLNQPPPPTLLGTTTNVVITNPTNPIGGRPPNLVATLTDNNPATFVTLANVLGLFIDMGQTNTIHRVYLLGSQDGLGLWPNWPTTGTNAPLGLVLVSVGNTTRTMQQVAAFTVPYDAGNPVDTEVDVRFSPVTGRYVRIQLQTNVVWGFNNWPGYALSAQPAPPPSGLAWNVGELELYGFTGPFTNNNAVVLPVGASNALSLAASDLSYYLGELTGQAHPIIPPSATTQFPGMLYRIDDLSGLAPNYATMTNNIAAGLLPNNVNVTISGREVGFTAWPYRCILWSVWEFLERQGVRWLYPEGHGDFVPTGNGVNLGILPLQYTPSATSIYANWDANSLAPWPLQNTPNCVRQGYLYPWRNRWNSGWNLGPLGGTEIPALPTPNVAVNSDYTEGFVGYPHNFSSVLPNRILDQNSNWWGYSAALGARIPPESNGAPAFCMDQPAVINWVAAKMTNIAAAQPLACTYPLNISHTRRPYNLFPTDATTYCADPQWCAASNLPTQPNPVPWVKLYGNSYSGDYYSFVTAVAQMVQQMGSGALVGALAYADVFLPPETITTFPTNVQVEVCYYGAPNLLITDPANAGMKSALDGWRSTGAHLATYDYALLHTDYWQTNPALPVPLVAGTVSRAQYAASSGAADGGCQANLGSLPSNPWNFYAYPRARWNTNQTAAQIEQEFFTGYFLEAAAPMLAYYQALESYQVTSGVNMHYAGYAYGITPNSFPILVLAAMQTNLSQAAQQATNWYVQQRVANAAAGFGWVITNSPDNLVGVNLTNTSPYPVLDPEPGPVSINLTNMIAPPNSVLGNNAYWQGFVPGGDWWFGAVGMIRQLYFMTAGTYLVNVVASGVPSGTGTWPTMNLYFGPAWNQVAVTSTNSATYTFTNTIPAGIFDVVVACSTVGSPPAQLVISGINVIRLQPLY